MSVFTFHALPLQRLLGTPKSLQLDRAALELAAVLYDFLLASPNCTLVGPSSFGEMLHTHCDIAYARMYSKITFAASLTSYQRQLSFCFLVNPIDIHSF